MGKRDVLAAFDILKDELKALIPELNRQASKLFESQSYKESRELTYVAENLIEYQKKVSELEEEWLNVSTNLKEEYFQSTEKLASHDHTSEQAEENVVDHQTPEVEASDEDMVNKIFPRMEKSKKNETDKEEFLIPLLQILVEHGGHLTTRQVYPLIEKSMKNTLTEEDLKPLSDGNPRIRYKNTLTWGRKFFAERGFLEYTVGTEFWSITAAGRNYLREYLTSN